MRYEHDDTPAWPELDAVIHTRVLGREHPQPGKMFIDGPGVQAAAFYDGAPEYSTEIVEAWQVVEFLAARNVGVEVSTYPDGMAEAWALVTFSSDYFEHVYHTGIVASAPLAICRVALQVVAHA